MQKTMRSAILIAMTLGAITFCSAQSCHLGTFDLVEEDCSCGGGERTVAYCVGSDGDTMCQNGNHIVNCSQESCDFYDGSECTAAAKPSYRINEPDLIAFVYSVPKSKPSCGTANVFDRWFSEKLRVQSKVQGIAAGASK